MGAPGGVVVGLVLCVCVQQGLSIIGGMRYQRIDLNLLIALDALLEERNVTRAAERMFITQSSMSGVLGRLRDYFEDPLLVTVGRSMHLTPLAESLMQPVRDIVLRVDAALGTRPTFDAASAKRHFTLIASDYVSHVLLTQVLSNVAQAAPGLSFDVRPTSVGMLQDLEQRRVDFVIVPAHLAVSEHPQQPLFEDSYRVIACRKHPDLRLGISADQYRHLGHVAFQNEQGHNPWFEQWYANEHGQTRRIEVVTHGFALLPHFVVGTRRIATVQTRLAQQFEQTMNVQLLEVPLPTPRLTEVLQWHQSRNEDPGVQWLRGQLVQVAAALPPV